MFDWLTEFDAQAALTCAMIFGARICDVSLGTLRTIAVVHGKRGLAFLLGFFEVLIWVIVVSRVISNLHNPAYAVSYALGFASGNYVGMVLESWFALGEQVIRVFTRAGADVAARLRAEGWAVTVFSGQGRDGPVSILFAQVSRREVVRVADVARSVDPDCYYVVDDVRLASTVVTQPDRQTGRRIIVNRK